MDFSTGTLSRLFTGTLSRLQALFHGYFVTQAYNRYPILKNSYSTASQPWKSQKRDFTPLLAAAAGL